MATKKATTDNGIDRPQPPDMLVPDLFDESMTTPFKLECCRAALGVWLLNLSEVGKDSASILQVSLRAIGEALEEAVSGDSLDALFAKNLVHIAEGALWDFCSLESRVPPDADDLRSTVELSLMYLTRATSDGSEQETAAAEASHG